MRSTLVALGLAAVAAAPTTPAAAAQELPLAPLRGQGQAVWPAFEGWYDNGDGSYVLYFGYHNRNADQVLDIPLGERNFLEPAEFDGDQPTRFEPLRHWGVFGIRVPSDHPVRDRIYWNLVIDGKTYRVPGHLQTDWKTDALGGGAAGNTPPVLRFGSAEGRGPLGVTAPTPARGSVGQPVELSVAATDEAGSGLDLLAAFRGGRGGAPPQIRLAWFKHQGPGAVTFSEQSGRVPAAGGNMATTATFDAAGDYVVRVRATDSGMETAGHAQCCWTNGYVHVTVTR